MDPTVQHVARVSQNIFSFFEGILTAEKEKQQVDSIPKNKTKGRNKTKTEQRFFPAGGCAPYWIVVTVQHLHPWLSVLLIFSLLHSLERRPLPPPPSLPFLWWWGSSGVVVTLERPGMKEENKHNFNRIFSAKKKQTKKKQNLSAKFKFSAIYF